MSVLKTETWEATPVLYCHNELGEAIVWDDLNNELCWLDIFGKKFWRFNPETQESQEFDTPMRPAAIALCDPTKVRQDTYLLPCSHGVGFYNVCTKEMETVFEHGTSCFLNDSRVDRQACATFCTFKHLSSLNSLPFLLFIFKPAL